MPKTEPSHTHAKAISLPSYVSINLHHPVRPLARQVIGVCFGKGVADGNKVWDELLPRWSVEVVLIHDAAGLAGVGAPSQAEGVVGEAAVVLVGGDGVGAGGSDPKGEAAATDG